MYSILMEWMIRYVKILLLNFSMKTYQFCWACDSNENNISFLWTPSMPRGPFLEGPGNFRGPKSNIQIEI